MNELIAMNVHIRSHLIQKNLRQPNFEKPNIFTAYGVVVENTQNLAEMHVSLHRMVCYLGYKYESWKNLYFNAEMQIGDSRVSSHKDKRSQPIALSRMCKQKS